MRKINTYTEDQRIAYLQEWQKSGLTQRAYCEQRGLGLRTFNNWKTSRMPGVQSTSRKSEEFIKMKPAVVRTELATAIGISIGRYKITVEGTFEPAVLAEVLTVLEARDVH